MSRENCTVKTVKYQHLTEAERKIIERQTESDAPKRQIVRLPGFPVLNKNRRGSHKLIPAVFVIFVIFVIYVIYAVYIVYVVFVVRVSGGAVTLYSR